MLTTSHITQIETTDRRVYAFRIAGGVTSEEMADIAEVMNAAFDRDETVSMLVLLHGFDASDAAAGLSLRSLEAQFRSLAHVERYGVVGAPAFAAAMIEAFGKIGPIEARTFDPDEEAAAWAFVGTSPVDAIALQPRPTDATTRRPDAEGEIARAAYAIWETEGRPEGCDREHWLRAKRLVEDGGAQTEGEGGWTSAQADEASQDSAQTPSDKPGPRNPLPRPVTNTEGFVAVDGKAAAAAVPSADPAPPDADAPPPKAGRKAAARKPVASI